MKKKLRAEALAKRNAIQGVDVSYEEMVITRLSVLSKTAFDVVRQLEENSKKLEQLKQKTESLKW